MCTVFRLCRTNPALCAAVRIHNEPFSPKQSEEVSRSVHESRFDIITHPNSVQCETFGLISDLDIVGIIKYHYILIHTDPFY